MLYLTRRRAVIVLASVALLSAGCRSGSSESNGASTSKLTHVAGSGHAGFAGDGGRAADAKLSGPSGLAFDRGGDLFVADGANNRVRRVDAKGQISTVAGNGVTAFAGDGGPATAASLSNPAGVAVDADGNLYIADTGNRRVRRVDPGGIITTVAGDGSASSALEQPTALAAGPGGQLFIADADRLKRLDRSGLVVTVAGGGQEALSRDPRPATSVQLSQPSALAVNEKGEVFVALPSSGEVVRIDGAGMASVVAGNAQSPTTRTDDGIPAVEARLWKPMGLAADGAGNLFIAQNSLKQLSRVDASGVIHNLVQVTKDKDKVVEVTAADLVQSSPLDGPAALVAGRSGELFVAEAGAHRVSRVSNAAGGVLSVEAKGHLYSARSQAAGPPPRPAARAARPAETKVEAIRPAVGGALGETAVVITGGPFDDKTTVRFGGREAKVSGVHKSVLLALSPPGRAGDTVVVTVTTGNGSTRTSPEARFKYVKSWERAAPLVFRRLAHTTTLLDPSACHGPGAALGYPCGQVLAAGGDQAFCIICFPLRQSELYDPAADVWHPTGFMRQGRMEHTSTLLADGRVLVVGGKAWGKFGTSVYAHEQDPTGLKTAELYDPTTRIWARTGDMAEARFAHTATLLSGPVCDEPSRPAWCGKVLVVGGVLRELKRPPIASAELYDPATGVWTSAGSLPEPRANHTASLLPDGRVMVVGGFVGRGDPLQIVGSVQVYDPATNSWSAGPQMGAPRALHTATTLRDGKVLVVGGVSGKVGDFVSSSELFDPVANEWRVAGIPLSPRSAHTATLLPSGFVLVAGGGPAFQDASDRADSVATVEVYDPGANHWAPARVLNTARGVHTAVALDGPACRAPGPPRYCGAVLAVGGGGTNDDPNANEPPVSQFSTELYR